MRLNVARLGGGLVIAGCILFLIAWVLLGLAGGLGLQTLQRSALALGLLAGGIGGALLAAAGEGPFAGRRSRLGLALMASCALGFLLFTFLPQDDIGLLYVYLLLLSAIALTGIVGALVLATALLRIDGAGRVSGRMLLGGIALVPLVYVLGALSEPTGLQLGAVSGPAGVAAIVLALGGLGIVGYLALRDRWSWR
jgi:hypothetical protein